MACSPEWKPCGRVCTKGKGPVRRRRGLSGDAVCLPHTTRRQPAEAGRRGHKRGAADPTHTGKHEAPLRACQRKSNSGYPNVMRVRAVRAPMVIMFESLESRCPDGEPQFAGGAYKYLSNPPNIRRRALSVSVSRETE